MVQLIDFSKYNSPEIYDETTQLTYAMASKNAIIAIIGLLIIGILMILRIRGSILIGILAATVVGIPFGVTDISGFRSLISIPPSMEPTFLKMDFAGLLRIGEQNIIGVIFTLVMVIIAFTLVDMFDTIGAIIGTGQKFGFLDKEGKFPEMKKALMADSVATSVGACLGIESGAGISEGGRTGLASVVTGMLFIVVLLFAPIVGIVPAAATAPALIIVGVLMMGAVKSIDFEDISESIPAFLTIILMPLTYSIATGIAAGLIIYPVMKIFKGKAKEVHPIVYVLAVLFIIRFVVLPH